MFSQSGSGTDAPQGIIEPILSLEFKPLLTLLELKRVSLHDAAPGCGR
jgi:hypothetical protein